MLVTVLRSSGRHRLLLVMLGLKGVTGYSWSIYAGVIKARCCASSCCCSGTSNINMGYSATQVKFQGAPISKGVCISHFPANPTYSHVRADTHSLVCLKPFLHRCLYLRGEIAEVSANIFGDLSLKDSSASQEVYDICDTFLASYCIHK